MPAMRILIALLIITAAILLAYGRVANFGWAWDDYLLFIDSPQLRGETIDWSAIVQPVIAGTSYFRPLVLLSFAVEFKAVGTGAGAAHAINLGIFTVNTLLVLTICLNLFRSLDLASPLFRASLAALTYGLHPAMTEPVAWVSGRFDLLCTSFALMAIWVALAIARESLRATLIGLAFLAALLSKEMAVTLPLTLGLVLIAKTIHREHLPLHLALRRILTTRWPTLAVMVLVAIAYLVFKFLSIGKVIHSDPVVLANIGGLSERLALVLRSLAFYISSAFVPFAHLSPFHSVDLETLTTTSNLATCVAMLLLILLIMTGTAHSKPLACLFLAALCSLLPVIQIIPLTIAGSIGAERFLAMPLAFLAFAIFAIRPVSLASVRPATQIVGSRILIGGWLMLAAGCLYVTVPLWRSDLTLWSWTYQQHPESRIVRQSYIVAALRERDFDAVKKTLESIRDGEGFDPILQLIYGNYLLKIGQEEEGISYLEAAIAVFPRPDLHPEDHLDDSNCRYLAYGLSTLATGYLDQHKYAEALSTAKSSQWYRPYSGSSKLWESFALYGLGRKEEADAAFDLAVRWYPESERSAIFPQRDKLLRSLANGKDDTTAIRAHEALPVTSSAFDYRSKE